jgi:hypothetical protein
MLMLRGHLLTPMCKWREYLSDLRYRGEYSKYHLIEDGYDYNSIEY